MLVSAFSTAMYSANIIAAKSTTNLCAIVSTANSRFSYSESAENVKKNMTIWGRPFEDFLRVLNSLWTVGEIEQKCCSILYSKAAAGTKAENIAAAILAAFFVQLALDKYKEREQLMAVGAAAFVFS